MLVSNRNWAECFAADRSTGAVVMRDIDMRAALIEELSREYAGDTETLIVDEFGLCQGNARIDLAVINGAINGFEIKSDRDNLDRLPSQQEIYNKVLDTVTVLVGRRHIKAVLSLVPSWWSVWEAFLSDGRVEFSAVRKGQQNPQVDPFSRVQLLWRDETLSILNELGLASRLLRKPRRYLWHLLVANLSDAELSARVCGQLKIRTNWRVVT